MKKEILSIEMLGNIYYFKKEENGEISLMMNQTKTDHEEFYSVVAEKETSM